MKNWIEQLQPIIIEYRDGEEPLDGDSVDNLCRIIKAKINLHEGNITNKEYENIMDGNDDEAQFRYKDKSGRGFKGTLNRAELLEMAEGPMTDETDWDGNSLFEWLDNSPEVDDTWENAANKITRIK